MQPPPNPQLPCSLLFPMLLNSQWTALREERVILAHGLWGFGPRWQGNHAGLQWQEHAVGPLHVLEGQEAERWMLELNSLSHLSLFIQDPSLWGGAVHSRVGGRGHLTPQLSLSGTPSRMHTEMCPIDNRDVPLLPWKKLHTCSPKFSSHTQLIIYFLTLWIYLFWTFHIPGTTQRLVFCDWPLLISTMFP